MNGRLPSFFATGVESIEDEGDCVRVTLSLRKTRGKRRECHPVVMILLTPNGRLDLVKRLALGPVRVMN